MLLIRDCLSAPHLLLICTACFNASGHLTIMKNAICSNGCIDLGPGGLLRKIVSRKHIGMRDWDLLRGYVAGLVGHSSLGDLLHLCLRGLMVLLASFLLLSLLLISD